MCAAHKLAHPRLVQALASARRDHRQIDDLDGLELLASEDEAMMVMLDVARTLAWTRGGWKIAATNARLQRQLRTAQPVCGITYARDMLDHPAVLRHADLLDPIVECEFFFTLGRALPPKGQSYDATQVADAVAAVHIGIEVAQCRFPRTRLPDPLYILADGFAAGHYVRGAPVPDWRRTLHNGVAVMLERNGKIVAQGTSRDVMGNPLHAVTWLCERLRSLGEGLRPGETIASGSCNILVAAHCGDVFRAHFADIGEVRLTLA